MTGISKEYWTLEGFTEYESHQDIECKLNQSIVRFQLINGKFKVEPFTRFGTITELKSKVSHEALGLERSEELDSSSIMVIYKGLVIDDNLTI